MSDKQSQQWKEKYLRNLDKLEQQEKAWQQTEDLLRRAIGRLAHTGYGIDKSLDRQLNRVRDAIKAKREADTLERLSREAGETAVKVQEAGQQAETDALLALNSLLGNIQLEPAKQKKITKLRKQLEKSDSLNHALPVIKQLVSLTTGAEFVPAERKSEAPAANGFFSRLLGGGGDKPPADRQSQTPAPTQTQTDSPAKIIGGAPAYVLERLLEQIHAGEQWSGRFTELRQRAVTCRDETEALGMVAEVAAVLSELTSMAESVGPEARTVVETLPSAGEALIALLEKVEIPAHLQERLGGIKNNLAKAHTLQQTLLSVQSIADLLGEIRSEVQEEKKELERFLEGVTSRIQTLSEHVLNLSENRGESASSRREFQQSFQSHMDDIRSSMQEEEDIDQLKHAIENGLDAIEQRMTEYIRREEALTKDAQERIEDLSGRLEDMKHEAFMLQQKMLEQREQALHDPLTGAFNRLAYEEKMEEEYQRWKRYQHPLSLLIVDIDHFKRINDTFGHLAGDKALKALALRLLQRVREVDIVARYGGEEFVVIMPDTDLDKAYKVAEKLRSVVASAGFHYRKQPVNITISCGLASFREGDDPHTAFKRADEALYAAKQSGRNRTHREGEPASTA